MASRWRSATPVTNRDAGYDRGAGTRAKGYKLHLIVARGGPIRAGGVQPVQADEVQVAARMACSTRLCGFPLADANSERNPLRCTRRSGSSSPQVQLLTPPRYRPEHGRRHHGPRLCPKTPITQCDVGATIRDPRTNRPSSEHAGSRSSVFRQRLVRRGCVPFGGWSLRGSGSVRCRSSGVGESKAGRPSVPFGVRVAVAAAVGAPAAPRGRLGGRQTPHPALRQRIKKKAA